eukprot:gene8148-1400_t
MNLGLVPGSLPGPRPSTGGSEHPEHLSENATAILGRLQEQCRSQTYLMLAQQGEVQLLVEELERRQQDLEKQEKQLKQQQRKALLIAEQRESKLDAWQAEMKVRETGLASRDADLAAIEESHSLTTSLLCYQVASLAEREAKLTASELRAQEQEHNLQQLKSDMGLQYQQMVLICGELDHRLKVLMSNKHNAEDVLKQAAPSLATNLTTRNVVGVHTTEEKRPKTRRSPPPPQAKPRLAITASEEPITDASGPNCVEAGNSDSKAYGQENSTGVSHPKGNSSVEAGNSDSRAYDKDNSSVVSHPRGNRCFESYLKGNSSALSPLIASDTTATATFPYPKENNPLLQSSQHSAALIASDTTATATFPYPQENNPLLQRSQHSATVVASDTTATATFSSPNMPATMSKSVPTTTAPHHDHSPPSPPQPLPPPITSTITTSAPINTSLQRGSSSDAAATCSETRDEIFPVPLPPHPRFLLDSLTRPTVGNVSLDNLAHKTRRGYPSLSSYTTDPSDHALSEIRDENFPVPQLPAKARGGHPSLSSYPADPSDPALTSPALTYVSSTPPLHPPVPVPSSRSLSSYPSREEDDWDWDEENSRLGDGSHLRGSDRQGAGVEGAGASGGTGAGAWSAGGTGAALKHQQQAWPDHSGEERSPRFQSESTEGGLGPCPPLPPGGGAWSKSKRKRKRKSLLLEGQEGSPHLKWYKDEHVAAQFGDREKYLNRHWETQHGSMVRQLDEEEQQRQQRQQQQGGHHSTAYEPNTYHFARPTATTQSHERSDAPKPSIFSASGHYLDATESSKGNPVTSSFEKVDGLRLELGAHTSSEGSLQGRGPGYGIGSKFDESRQDGGPRDISEGSHQGRGPGYGIGSKFDESRQEGGPRDISEGSHQGRGPGYGIRSKFDGSRQEGGPRDSTAGSHQCRGHSNSLGSKLARRAYANRLAAMQRARDPDGKSLYMDMEQTISLLREESRADRELL